MAGCRSRRSAWPRPCAPTPPARHTRKDRTRSRARWSRASSRTWWCCPTTSSPSIPRRSNTCAWPPRCSAARSCSSAMPSRTHRCARPHTPGRWRAELGGVVGGGPEQKVGGAEAVGADAAGSAYAEGQDAVKGTLEPGKLADLVVLADDIFAIDPAASEHVRVDATLLGGEVVFKRDAVPDTPMPATP